MHGGLQSRAHPRSRTHRCPLRRESLDLKSQPTTCPDRAVPGTRSGAQVPERYGTWGHLEEQAMRPSEEEEYKRYQGLPASLQPQCDPGGVDLRWLRRPLIWLRWRVAVRRRGPYAPDFDQFRRSR